VPTHYNPLIEAIVSLPKPVVAAVNGPAAGAGASLAFACDVRVAADDASFLMAFARVGLGPDSAASWTLPRLVGHGRAAAMLLLAEPVAAAQALEMGLVSMVVPASDLVATATGLAEKLASGPTAAYAAIKETLAFSASHSLADSLAQEAAAQARCGHTEDHRNAVAAFLAKRPASFTGR
jgi:2-(1,2-epoxy-1,2-dihydrophenyl)acetyl-CoA isomerase